MLSQTAEWRVAVTTLLAGLRPPIGGGTRRPRLPAVGWLSLSLACASPIILLPLAVRADPRASEATMGAALEIAESAEVIINLREPRAWSEGSASRSANIQRDQDEVLAALCGEFSLTRRYRHVPAVAGTIQRAGAALLKSDPRVHSLQIDGAGGGQLERAVPAIGGDRARSSFDLSGKGVRVAILDTGVDTDHPDLGAAIVAQHCFTYPCPPLFTRESTSAEDDHGHGSNVAGIVASRGNVASAGFAPGAELVVVKVNDHNDAGRVSDWVAGLDWVYDELPSSHVKVVNLSFGTTLLYSGNCDEDEPALAAAIANLTEAGVAIFAASGNQGSTTMIPAPACNTGVIAVGASYDSDVGFQPPMASTYAQRWGRSFANCADQSTAFDQIACFTNSNPELDIVAPGAPMTSDTLRGGTDTYSGTSQASPVAAGVAALMLQCNPMLTPTEVEQIMKYTGVPAMDPKSGRMFPSLRAFEAVRMACGIASPAGDGSAGASAGAGESPAGGAAPIAGNSGDVPVTTAPPGSLARGTVPRAGQGGSDDRGVAMGAGSAPPGADSGSRAMAAPSSAATSAGGSCSAAGLRGSGPPRGLWLLALIAWWYSRRSNASTTLAGTA
jgi:subtilisin family serine protease